MERLKGQSKITYDTNILVYYCFSTKKHKIKELTSKTHILTEYLIKNNTKIIIPKFIVDELNKVTFSKIVSDYVSKSSEVTNLPKNPTFLFRIELKGKIMKKFNTLINKEWVLIESELPDAHLVTKIEDFFDKLDVHPQKQHFLNLKKRDKLMPSDIDIKLIAFSKEMESILISNDYDLTFFADELFEKNLSNRIFGLKELDIYNN